MSGRFIRKEEATSWIYIGNGRTSFVEDPEKRQEALKLVVGRYSEKAFGQIDDNDGPTLISATKLPRVRKTRGRWRSSLLDAYSKAHREIHGEIGAGSTGCDARTEGMKEHHGT